MPPIKLKPAILIISDTVSRDPSTDQAGVILSTTFANDGRDQWTTPVTQIVPDDVSAIQSAVRRWCDDVDEYVNLIVTTGGTGFAARDCTPEAVAPLVEREAPGLVYVPLCQVSFLEESGC